MIINVKATPNAKTSAIKRYENSILYVAVAAEPEEGAANAELVKYLKKVLGVPVKLLTGSTSRMKRVGAEITEAALKAKVEEAMGE